MILNPKKCKELRVCFFKGTVELQPLVIARLEIVQSYKALGLTIQSNLKYSIYNYEGFQTLAYNQNTTTVWYPTS